LLLQQQFGQGDDGGFTNLGSFILGGSLEKRSQNRTINMIMLVGLKGRFEGRTWTAGVRLSKQLEVP
jgi:hypothetical protein